MKKLGRLSHVDPYHGDFAKNLYLKHTLPLWFFLNLRRAWAPANKNNQLCGPPVSGADESAMFDWYVDFLSINLIILAAVWFPLTFAKYQQLIFILWKFIKNVF